MIRDHDLETLQKGVRRFVEMSTEEKFTQMRRNGLIREDMSMQDWNAYLAVLEVRMDLSGRASEFWCLMPTLSSPGNAKIAISRQSMEKYLREGRRIITAYIDPETKALDAGEDIHLTSHKAIRTDRNDIAEDNLENLPRYSASRSKM